MKTIEQRTSYRACAMAFASMGATAMAKPNKILNFILHAISDVDEGQLSAAGTKSSLLQRPKVLLALLTYSYARGVYASRDIVMRLLYDNSLREQISITELPVEGEIREFRERNRGILRLCLASVLSLMAEDKLATGVVTKINRTAVIEEANRRITMASCTDAGCP